METTPLSPVAHWGTPDMVFDRFEGAWNLDRGIEGEATMSGVAGFTRLAAGGPMQYREQARVRLADGQAFDGQREYVFERSPGGFSVLFAETTPRLFHRIVLAREGDVLVGSAGHLCIADRYDSRYTFLPDGSFVIQHVVRGPRKDYLSRTVFTWRGA